MWVLAVPVMLACVMIGFAMRGWTIRTLNAISHRGLIGAKYSTLNPDGFVIWFEAQLLRLLFRDGAEVVSSSERFWFCFYAITRIIGVIATLTIGVGMLQEK